MSILLELDVTDDDPALTDGATLGAHAVGPRAVALDLRRAAVLALERRHPHNRPLTSSGSKHKQTKSPEKFADSNLRNSEMQSECDM